MVLRPAVFDRQILAFDATGFAQSLAERSQEQRIRAWRGAVEVPDHRHRRLLRADDGGPRDNCAAEDQEIAPVHQSPRRRGRAFGRSYPVAPRPTSGSGEIGAMFGAVDSDRSRCRGFRQVTAAFKEYESQRRLSPSTAVIGQPSAGRLKATRLTRSSPGAVSAANRPGVAVRIWRTLWPIATHNSR